MDKYFKEKYKCPVGLSDHSGQIFASLGAVSLGADIIEAHITFDKRMFGPDSKASLNIEEFSTLVKGIRFIEKAKEDKNKFSAKARLKNILESLLLLIAILKKGN